MKHPFNNLQRFSIRKFSFGAASVLLGTVLLGQNPVGAQEQTQGQEPNIQLAEDRTPPPSSDLETSRYDLGNLRQEQEKKEQDKKAEEKKIPDSQEGKKVSDASRAGSTGEASNGSDRSAEETSSSSQHPSVGSDRATSPSSNNGESSEGSDRSSRSAVSGSDRSTEETSNSGQHTPARRARSVGENPDTVNRASQSSPVGSDRSSQPVPMWRDRGSVLNGKYSYKVSQAPIPDNDFNNYNVLLEHWNHAMFNWLRANSKGDLFDLYVDEFGSTIKRKTGDKSRRHKLYREEATDDRASFDVFSHYRTAEYVVLEFVGGGDGSANLKVVGPGEVVLTRISIPKTDLFMRQSDYDREEESRRRQEAEERKRNAVKTGLGKRVQGVNSIDESNGERIPHGSSLKGYQLFMVGESSEENIKDIDVSNIDDLGLRKTKVGIGTRQAALQLETGNSGTQGLAATVFGRRTVRVTTTTQGGHVATKDVTLTFGMPKPQIVTEEGDLREQANTKPTVTARLSGPVDNKNIPPGHKLMMYLVSGGSNDSTDFDNVYASGYEVVARTEVKSNGQAVFDRSTYLKGQIGTQPLKVVVAIVSTATGTPVTGLISPLSDSSVTATEPLRKDEAKQEITDAADAKKREIDNNNQLTQEEKDAARRQVQDALTQALRDLEQATTTDGVDDAKQGGERAIGNVSTEGPTKKAAKNTLEQELDKTLKAIDGKQGLPKEESDKLKDALDKIFKKTKDEIDKAKDANSVLASLQNGTDSMSDLLDGAGQDQGNAGGTTPGGQGNAGGTTPGGQGNAGGTTPGGQGNAGGTTPGSQGNAGGTTPGGQGNAGGTTPGGQGNAGGTTPGGQGNAGGTTPGGQGNAGGTTPGGQGNAGGTTPGGQDQGNAGGTTPGGQGNAGGTTPGQGGNNGGGAGQGGQDQVDTTNTRNKRSLPNTGTASSAAMLAAAATSAFLGLGLVGRRRRKKK